MKGITGNPVLDAYQRGGVSKVGAAKAVEHSNIAAPSAGSGPDSAAVKVAISPQARDLAANSSAMRRRTHDFSRASSTSRIAITLSFFGNSAQGKSVLHCASDWHLDRPLRGCGSFRVECEAKVKTIFGDDRKSS